MTKHRQPSMERYQVILAYDGSHYKGFQRQADHHSVQAAVEDCLGKIGWQGQSILAAGRTDTGVHATGQVIAFDLEWNHPLWELRTAMNANLPADVVVQEVRAVCPTFHPRYDASWRRYIYRIYCMPVRQPLLEPFAWRVWPAADLTTLNEAARFTIGRHDFGAFGTPLKPGGSTHRLVLEASWKAEGQVLTYEITAQAFLYHMVRRLTFMQVIIAQGRRPLSDFQYAIENGVERKELRNSEKTSASRLVHGLAPAQGLVLAEVYYSPEVLRLATDNNENKKLG